MSETKPTPVPLKRTSGTESHYETKDGLWVVAKMQHCGRWFVYHRDQDEPIHGVGFPTKWEAVDFLTKRIVNTISPELRQIAARVWHNGKLAPPAAQGFYAELADLIQQAATRAEQLESEGWELT